MCFVTEFQKRVLQMLCQLTESIKEMANGFKVEDSTYHVVKISTMEELMNVEKDMKDPSNRLNLVRDGEQFLQVC